MNNSMAHHACSLFIGNPERTFLEAYFLAHKLLCNCDTHTTCTTYNAITQKAHAHILWLSPQKSAYTKQDIELLFEQVAFDRSNNDPYCIIIQQADLMSTHVANSLLKTLEEPPMGYFFILIAQSAERILPTIRSRCITTHYQHTYQIENHPLVKLCLEKYDVYACQSLLENTQAITHEDCMYYLRHALDHLLKKMEHNPSQETHKRIAMVSQALEKPPMPGGAKIFIKNIALQSMQLT